jgi:hypothetical protein
MTSEQMQRLLQGHNIEFTAKKIPHGRQFRLSDGAIVNVYASGKIVWQGKTTADSVLKVKDLLYAATEPPQATASSKEELGAELQPTRLPINIKDLGDDSERLLRIATIFESAVKQARDSELKIDEELTVDAHADHVCILAGGHPKMLFKLNAEGAIGGPVLGFHDATWLGTIDDDGVEFNLAWAIKSELLDQKKWQPDR